MASAGDLTIALQQIAGADLYAFDLETTGFDPHKERIEWFSLATATGCWAFPLVGPDALPYRETLEKLRSLFADTSKTVTGWNLKFDLKFMLAAGIECDNRAADGMLGLRLLDENKPFMGLKEAAKEFLKVEMRTYEDATGLFGTLDGGFEAYSREDARCSYDLWVRIVEPALRAEDLLELAIGLEGEVLKVTAEMEWTGLCFDRSHLLTMADKTREQIAVAERRCYELAGQQFLLNSPEQVSRVLFREMRIPHYDLKVGKTGQISTAEEELKKLGGTHPIVDALLEYRAANKLLTTYLIPLAQRCIAGAGRIYADFVQMQAVSGRYSSREPNLQNIPKDPWHGVRKAIVAPEGFVIIQADWSQIELRFMAYVSGDQDLMRCYVGDNPVDVHDQTWKRTGCKDRRQAKVLNFGLLYGMGPQKLSRELGGVAIEEALKYHRTFFKAYPRIRRYYDQVFHALKERGFITTFTGRRRRLSQAQRDNLQPMDDAHRETLNTPVQGGAGDLLKIAMRNLHRELKTRRRADPQWEYVRVVSTVHDELLVECPKHLAHEAAERLRDHMENCIQLPVVFEGRKTFMPIKADIAIVRNWGESAVKEKDRIKLYREEGMSDEEIAFYFPGQRIEELAA